MRGDGYVSQAPAAVSDETVTASTAAGPQAGTSNIEENTSAAKSPGSVVWLLSLLGIAAAYYYLYNKNWKEAVSKDGILAFLHQSFIVTLLAVAGINIFNVVLTKLAAMKIPLVSRVAGTFLPLFHL